MNRRNFLMRLGAGMIASLIIRPTFEDVKMLDKAWYGGAAGAGKSEVLTESEIVKIELERIMPKVKDLFERDDTFYKMIKSRHGVE